MSLGKMQVDELWTSYIDDHLVHTVHSQRHHPQCTHTPAVAMRLLCTLQRYGGKKSAEGADQQGGLWKRVSSTSGFWAGPQILVGGLGTVMNFYD